MAVSSGRTHVACVALLLLLLLGVATETNAAVDLNQMQVVGSPAPSPMVNSIGKLRDRVASRQNLCKRACGSCCARCDCVPPGTSGNQDQCHATPTSPPMAGAPSARDHRALALRRC
ncbi:hypothetical protein PR202_ga18601 [Eleusine coracana subsp. coracana]|uniref:Uncharacterized protein n=1 Tax=Eleusine coracana subsp. coracana TaxID=191504 RepID=A0AAV5CTR6_ELECO|nr:hypothetical protein PR202_ga18601 [Eleusine coracana subsp. coracana]